MGGKLETEQAWDQPRRFASAVDESPLGAGSDEDCPVYDGTTCTCALMARLFAELQRS